ncbi:MAG: hypothetical protein HY553_02505 [Elusimicrobia bacterium]|nr:hypothetical protein [Elusimicrobiota bacterium]
MTLLTIAAALALAQDPSVTVELQPPPAAVAIGMPVELEGTARYPERFELSFQPPASSTGAVAVLGAELGGVEIDGGQKKQSIRVRVAAFELGPVAVPPLTWRLQAADGTGHDALSAPVRFESVGPPGATPEAGIRDIRGPLGVAWWPLVLLAAALAAAGFAWWRKRRGEGGLGAAPSEVDRRLPHERALDELHALYTANVPVKEFYIRLTDILRLYFEGRFGVSATVLTTGDLLRRLRDCEIERPLLAHCREVFDHADLVKFAKWIPATPEIRKDWTEAENLVRQTAPKPPPVETAPAPK